MAASPQPFGALPALAFSVQRAERVEHAAVPTLRFVLGIESDRDVRSILLDVQVQIAARRRAYDTGEHDPLFTLFGAQKDWGTTLRTLLWTRQTLVVPPFTGGTDVDLLVACSYDLEVTASSYFSALTDGEVPLEFLFSGSVFYAGAGGMLQTSRISWEQNVDFRMPVRVWRETINRHFPDAAWLRLQRDAFDRLRAYRSRHALPSWEEALDRLLASEENER